MASPRPSRRANLALAALSTLAALAFGEAAVRWIRPQPLEAACVWEDGTLRHLPSFSHRYTRAGMFSNVIRYNALGLRGPEVAPHRAAGTTRVLFLGDSFVEGKQVGEDEVMTAAMTRLARERGMALEIVNAGVSGYGTAEELRLWERLGPELSPDVVLVGLYTNDIGNNVERGLFVLDGAGSLLKAREPKRPKARWAYDARHWLAARSHLYMLAKEGLRGGLRGKEAQAVDGRDGAFLEAQEAFATVPEPANPPASWRLTLALLDALRLSVEASGARFAVVLLPARFQVYEEIWREHSAALGLEPGRYDLETPGKILAAWSSRTGAQVIDLLGPFRDRAPASPPLYFRIDTHFTAAGHRLAAEVVLEALPQRDAPVQ